MVLAGKANDARQKRFRRTEWTVACSPDAKGREEMVRVVVDGGVTKAAAARRFNTTSKTSPMGRSLPQAWHRGLA